MLLNYKIYFISFFKLPNSRSILLPTNYIGKHSSSRSGSAMVPIKYCHKLPISEFTVFMESTVILKKMQVNSFIYFFNDDVFNKIVPNDCKLLM